MAGDKGHDLQTKGLYFLLQEDDEVGQGETTPGEVQYKIEVPANRSVYNFVAS